MEKYNQLIKENQSIYTLASKSQTEKMKKSSIIDDLLDKIRRKMRIDIVKFLHSDKKYYRNKADCGIGKTQITIKEIVKYCKLNPLFRFLIVVPSHKMVDNSENENDESNNIKEMIEKLEVKYLYLQGKNRLCLLPNHCQTFSCKLNRKQYLYQVEQKAEFNQYYFPNKGRDEKNSKKTFKCKYYTDCPYHTQFNDLNATNSEKIPIYQIIICVQAQYDTVLKRSEFPFDCIIFEESFDQALLDTKVIPSDHKLINNPPKNSIGGNKEGKDYNIAFTLSLETIPEKLSTNAEFLYTWIIERGLYKKIRSKRDYELYRFLKQHPISGQACYMTNNPNKITLFSRKRFEIPPNTKIIFNCATTPLELMENMFGIPLDQWKIFETLEFQTIQNPSLIVGASNLWWGKNKTNNYFRNFSKFLMKFSRQFKQFHQRLPQIIVITKLEIEEKIEETKELSNIQVVHYGDGRGSNKWNSDQGCDLVIIFGRFGFTPLNREMFRRIGFLEELITQMVQSEMMQCLHRARLHLHPDIPILFFADPLFMEFLFPDKYQRDNMRVSVSRLKSFNKFPSLNPRHSIKALKEKMGITAKSNQKISEFRKFATWIWKYGYKKDPETERTKV